MIPFIFAFEAEINLYAFNLFRPFEDIKNKRVCIKSGTIRGNIFNKPLG